MEVILLSIVLFAVVMLAMAVGVIFKRPCLRGSCGGPDVMGPDGESLSCATCPNRKKGRRADAAASSSSSASSKTASGGLPVVQ